MLDSTINLCAWKTLVCLSSYLITCVIYISSLSSGNCLWWICNAHRVSPLRASSRWRPCWLSVPVYPVLHGTCLKHCRGVMSSCPLGRSQWDKFHPIGSKVSSNQSSLGALTEVRFRSLISGRLGFPSAFFGGSLPLFSWRCWDLDLKAWLKMSGRI